VAARELAHTGNTTIAIAMCSGDSLDENGKFPGKKQIFPMVKSTEGVL
jgi:hypothetical protein